MTTTTIHILLDNLMEDVRKIILQVSKLEHVPAFQLQLQPAPGKWSVAQILEHMNFYSTYYLKEIENNIHRKESITGDQPYKPGWFGNYFTKMMSPRDGEVKNKMKTMKAAIPHNEVDGKASLQQFIADQHVLLNLLQIAKSSDINKIRIATSLSKMIKLKLGDTFRFFIAHEQRHMIQIANTLPDGNN